MFAIQITKYKKNKYDDHKAKDKLVFFHVHSQNTHTTWISNHACKYDFQAKCGGQGLLHVLGPLEQL